MMDNLRDYGTDHSTSDSDLDTESDLACTTEVISTSMKVDYFGICNDSDEELTASSPKKWKGDDCQKKHVIDGTTVEIPSSPFWYDLSGEHILIESKTSSGDQHTVHRRKQDKGVEYPEKRAIHGTSVQFPSLTNNFIRNEQSQNTEKEKTSSNSFMSATQNKLTAHGEIKYFNHRTNQSSGSSKNKDIITRGGEIEKRKLFYVHSKIQPRLNDRCSFNRVPSNLEKQLMRHSGVVNRVKWNVPNYSHIFASASMDATVKIWNVWSSLEPCVMILSQHSKAVFDVEWSRCGKKLLSCSYDRTALLMDVDTAKKHAPFISADSHTDCPMCRNYINSLAPEAFSHMADYLPEAGKVLRTFPQTSYVSCGKYHTVDPNLVLIGAVNSLQCWDMRIQGEAFRTFTCKDYFGQVQDIMFSQDGRTFFSSGDLVSKDSADRNIMAWDFNTGIILSNQIYQERYTCTRLKSHPKKQEFLAQTSGGYVAIFSLIKPYKMTKSKRLEGHKLLGYNIGFDITPDGKSVLSGSSDGDIYCYDYETGKTSRRIRTGLDICMDVNFHPVLNSIVCCGWNGVIQVWS